MRRRRFQRGVPERRSDTEGRARSRLVLGRGDRAVGRPRGGRGHGAGAAPASPRACARRPRRRIRGARGDRARLVPVLSRRARRDVRSNGRRMGAGAPPGSARASCRRTRAARRENPSGRALPPWRRRGPSASFRADGLGGWRLLHGTAVALWFVALALLLPRVVTPPWQAALAVVTVGLTSWAMVVYRTHPCAAGAAECYRGLVITLRCSSRRSSGGWRSQWCLSFAPSGDTRSTSGGLAARRERDADGCGTRSAGTSAKEGAMSMGKRAIVAVAVAAAMAAGAVAPSANASDGSKPPSLEFLGQAIVPTGTTFAGTTVGGLSSITYDAVRGVSTASPTIRASSSRRGSTRLRSISRTGASTTATSRSAP